MQAAVCHKAVKGELIPKNLCIKDCMVVAMFYVWEVQEAEQRPNGALLGF